MIPNHYHFIWFGRAFPFTHALAIRSVAATSAPDAITLHAPDDLRGQPHFDALVEALPMLEVRKVDPAALINHPGLPSASRLYRMWQDLLAQRRWAALSDVLRYLVLYHEGGVYLDLDTITVRDLRPLLKEPGFCGRERILVDAVTARRNSPWRYFRTGPLDLARWICAHSEGGIRRFSRIARFYSAAINGAVLALPALHPLMCEALARVPDLASQIEARRPAIGPDLLQDLIDGKKRSDVTVFAPEHFYPLGPQMAAHLFRIRRDAREVERALAESIRPETFIVHWYNDNLESLPRPPDGKSIRALAAQQMFSRLALPFIPRDGTAGSSE